MIVMCVALQGEFGTAMALLRGWECGRTRQRVGVRTLYIEPGSPWENEYIESFNGKLRDELLNGEILDTWLEAKVLTERWRKHYNRRRPHSAFGYRPLAPEAVAPLPLGSATLRRPARARTAADLA